MGRIYCGGGKIGPLSRVISLNSQLFASITRTTGLNLPPASLRFPKSDRLLARALTAAAFLLSPALYAAEPAADARLVFALKQAVRNTPDLSEQMDTVNWLAGMSEHLETRIEDPFYRIDLLKIIHTEASRAGLSPELVLSLIEVESQFDRNAVSRSGARGLMQVMPFWKKEIGHPQDNLFHPLTNLRYGCTILKYYIGLTDGDVRDALERYNGSPDKKAYADKVLGAFDSTWGPSSNREVSE